MKDKFWIIDMIGKLEEIARKTSDLDAEEEIKECVEVLKDKLL